MFDVTIIGAGIIGCTAARELSKYDLKICVLEKGSDIAVGTTKANSAIIHAGFDAKKNTLKGKLNVKGNAMFDELSRELDFPFKRIGALVLCFDERDIGKLEFLYKQGIENGVPGLKILNKLEVNKMEKNISEKVVAALYAPSSGIVCPYEMAIAFAENANTNGVDFKFDTEVKNIIKTENGFKLITNNKTIETALVINAAGVYSDNMNNFISKNKISIKARKGEYCLFDKADGNMVSSTIFQLPTKMGKGVLVTPTVDGNLLIGPNAIDIEDKEDLTTTQNGIEEILSKAKLSIKYVPTRDLITSFAGLRAHSIGDDFIIEEAEDAIGFINAAGIESPGLSSAPAIAEILAGFVINKLNSQKNINFNPIRHSVPKFRELSNDQRRELIEKDPKYGKIVCRCETVTEGEIISAIRRPLGARTLDGVKRRARAGMGRCQSGFCSSRILDILERELKLSPTEITKFGGKSAFLIGKNKELI